MAITCSTKQNCAKKPPDDSDGLLRYLVEQAYPFGFTARVARKVGICNSHSLPSLL